MIIIKSMSRANKSFSQLYDYLTRDKSSHTFSRNTYSQPDNKKEFVNEFYKNAEYLKNARGKVYMYHEVLSLEKNNLSKEREKEILLDLAEKYLYQRAEDHLAFGVVHEDKEHTHVHLMISSNEIEQERRVRLSKKEFADIQNRLENYKNQKYKELSQSSLYKDTKDLSKEKQQEQELKNRGAKSIKDTIKENLEQTFKKATSKTYFDNHLKSLGYEVYDRGKSQGIKYKGKNYRFKTLGLEIQYKQILKEFEKNKQRKEKRQNFKDEKVKSKKYSNNTYRKQQYYKQELEEDLEL
jgi:hypothetical protein